MDMPEKIGALFFMGAKVLSIGGLVVSTTVASIVSLATATPLSGEDLAHLASGDGQAVMAVMVGLLVMAILGLCGVITHMFKVNEKRHMLGHAERDKRENNFHDLSEKMIVVVAESNEARRETNLILTRFESTVGKCHDETVILKKGEHIKAHK